MAILRIPLSIDRSLHAGHPMPVTIGIPFTRGSVDGLDKLMLVDEREKLLPLQCQVLARWRDGSVKWALLDFQATPMRVQSLRYHLCIGDGSSPGLPSFCTIANGKSGIAVTRGTAKFSWRDEFLLYTRGGADVVRGWITLRDTQDITYIARCEQWQVESDGALRTTIKTTGTFHLGKRQFAANFTLRLSFYSGFDVLKSELILHNPLRKPLRFRDLSWHLVIPGEGEPIKRWKTRPEDVFRQAKAGKFVIYQESSRERQGSGGYRVYQGRQKIAEGDRITPIVELARDQGKVCALFPEFWQNFPKALKIEDDALTIRLFPILYDKPFVLAAGEQKTHTCYIGFAEAEQLACYPAPIVRLEPAYYRQCGVLADDKYLVRNRQTAASAIDGSDSLLHRVEANDIYGWRNYGALPDRKIAVDAILQQYLYSGRKQWWRLGDALARHIADFAKMPNGLLYYYLTGNMIAKEALLHTAKCLISRTTPGSPLEMQVKEALSHTANSLIDESSDIGSEQLEDLVTLLRQPSAEEISMSTQKRPLAITLVCIVFFISALAPLALILSGDPSTYGTSSSAFLAALTVIVLVIASGFWRMKKWALLAYIALVALSQLLLVLSGKWHPNALGSLVMGIIVAIIGFIYYDDMS